MEFNPDQVLVPGGRIRQQQTVEGAHLLVAGASLANRRDGVVELR